MTLPPVQNTTTQPQEDRQAENAALQTSLAVLALFEEAQRQATQQTDGGKKAQQNAQEAQDAAARQEADKKKSDEAQRDEVARQTTQAKQITDTVQLLVQAAAENAAQSAAVAAGSGSTQVLMEVRSKLTDLSDPNSLSTQNLFGTSVFAEIPDSASPAAIETAARTITAEIDQATQPASAVYLGPEIQMVEVLLHKNNPAFFAYRDDAVISQRDPTLPVLVPSSALEIAPDKKATVKSGVDLTIENAYIHFSDGRVFLDRVPAYLPANSELTLAA